MVGYATEAELEAYTTREFSAATTVTSTQIGTFLTQMSALLDGINNVAEAHYGAETTCPEWVKQAVLAACGYKIDSIYLLQVPDPEKIISILKSYTGKKASTDGASPHFDNIYHDSGGEEI